MSRITRACMTRGVAVLIGLTVFLGGCEAGLKDADRAGPSCVSTPAPTTITPFPYYGGRSWMSYPHYSPTHARNPAFSPRVPKMGSMRH